LSFKDIFPLESITRCHGRSYLILEECKIQETCRAALGFPASFAIIPYVNIFPLGIFFMIVIVSFVNLLIYIPSSIVLFLSIIKM
jgi:hypothetical protein